MGLAKVVKKWFNYNVDNIMLWAIVTYILIVRKMF
jgi:hypothetical protein